MIIFSCNVLNVIALECVAMNNQKCQIITKIIDVNSNEPLFYPYSVEMNKFSGSCNGINDLYGNLCVPDFVKNIDAKVFNLMSRSNETRHIK